MYGTFAVCLFLLSGSFVYDNFETQWDMCTVSYKGSTCKLCFTFHSANSIVENKTQVITVNETIYSKWIKDKIFWSEYAKATVSKGKESFYFYI